MRRLSATFVAFLLVASVAAQSRTTRLFVFATDRAGAAVEDLAQADFDVKENGASARIVSAHHETAPMRIVLLVDNSTPAMSMVEDFKKGLRELVSGVPDDAELALVTVAGGYSARVATTLDRTRIQKGIDSLYGDGGTQVAQALIEAGDKLFRDKAERWPVFVLVTTDAGENTSMVKQPVFDAFSEHLNAVAATVHAVVITSAGGNSGGGKVLDTMAKNLATNTGGSYVEVADSRTLPEQLARVAARITADRRRMSAGYAVEYASTAKGDPSIEIGAKREGVTLQPSLRRTP